MITAKLIIKLFIVLIQHYVIKVCQWLAAGQWFSLGIRVSSTNKTDYHFITEIVYMIIYFLMLNLSSVHFKVYTVCKLSWINVNFLRLVFFLNSGLRSFLIFTSDIHFPLESFSTVNIHLYKGSGCSRVV
jgi:hypothetical protein